jgi:chitin synthase
MSEVTTTRPPAVQNSIDLHSAQPARRQRRIRRRDAARPLLDRRRRTSLASPQRPQAGLATGRFLPPASSQRKVEATREPILARAAPLWIPGPRPSLAADPEPRLALSDGAFGQSGEAIERGFKNVFCMTLYNEPLEQLKNSLTALIASIEAQEYEAHAPTTKSCIVIIADGRDRVDPDILQFFQSLGLVETGSSFLALGETVHFSHRRADDIMATLGAGGHFRCDVSFAICVKNMNRGKLHSHALFFQRICPALGPDLCYQLDVGTVVAADAVSKLVAYMAEESDVAAAASRILTPTPQGAAASTLSVWQYMDFVAQKAVTWPTEVASGYLSVIPGQFCVFRWSAVSAPSSDIGGERPLDTYLRGLNAIAPLERVMFLAEDRVFGNEIVLARDKSWRIGYCPAAQATTDACDTFGELLRQRRRWQNSALAVRLWLWGRLPAYLARPDKSAFDKARFTGAMLWQGLLTASEVMSPAFLVLLLLAAAGGLIHPRSAMISAAVGGALAAVGGLVWLTFANRTSRWQSRLCLARDVAATLAVVSLLGLAFYVNPLQQAALLVAPVVLMAGVITASMPGQRSAALRHLSLYFLTDRLVSFVLYGYALANMHNVTWGTKGLTDDSGAERAEKRRMLRLRTVIAGSVVAVNLALVVLGLEHSGIWIKSVSSIVEIFVLLCLAVAGTAVAAWAVSAGSALPSLCRAAAIPLLCGHAGQAFQARRPALPEEAR